MPSTSAHRSRRPNRRWLTLTPLCGVLVLFLASLVLVQQKVAAHHRLHQIHAVQVDPARQAVQLLLAEIRRWSDRIETAPEGAPAELRPLAADRVELPADLEHYEDQLEAACAAGHRGMFPPGLVQRLARHGHPMFLAAVMLLQQRDYQHRDCCADAAALQHLLEELTGVHGLCVLPPEGEPQPADRCRFAAAATAWRELAERYAATPAAFRELQLATGKITN